MSAFWFIAMFVVWFATQNADLWWLVFIPMVGFGYEILKASGFHDR